MKKSIYFTLGILSIFMGCTKEISEDLFAVFELEASAAENTLLEVPQATDISAKGVSPEVLQGYTFSYTVTEGTGYYEIDDERINEGRFTVLPRADFTMFYVPTSIGTHLVTLTARDRGGNETNTTLTYEVEDTGFTFEIAPPSPLLLGETEDFTLTITDSEAAEYETEFNIIRAGGATTGEAAIIVNGEEVFPNTPIPTVSGSNTWQFEALAPGLVTLSISTTNSFNVTVTKRFTVEITEVINEFTFDITPPSPPVLVGETKDFSLTVTDSETSEYETEFNIIRASGATTGAAAIIVNGEEVLPNTAIPTVSGSNTWQFEALSSGRVTLEFRTENTTGIIVTKRVAIEITETLDFTVNATTLTNTDISVGTPVSINIELLENSGTSSYMMSYTSFDSSSTLTIDQTGASYTTGAMIPITPGTTAVQYTGTEAGTHNITFTVQDASTPALSQTAAVTINYSALDTEAPQITLRGDNPQVMPLGGFYQETGADVNDGSFLMIENNVNISIAGDYTVIYSATDTAGNTGEVERIVTVKAPPTLTLSGANPQFIALGTPYSELNAITDGTLTIDASNVDTTITGTYTVVYTATDNIGQTTRLERDVIVNAPLRAIIEAISNDAYTSNNPRVIVFSNAQSTGAIERSIWTIRNGSIVIETIEQGGFPSVFTYPFTAPNQGGSGFINYTVTLEVIDASGQTSAPVTSQDIRITFDDGNGGGN